jgi:2-amino-4-hydroxy-6-hydroxymethyldihydropteridine diphosphokinase
MDMHRLYIGLGANLPSPVYGSPQATLQAAIAQLSRDDISIIAQSSWWESAPVPVSDQPWYVNGVVMAETLLTPLAVLARLAAIELAFGRVRAVRNAARIVDLDYLDDERGAMQLPTLTLPHPRLQERGFVLYPLREIAPNWRHPMTGIAIDALIASLPEGQITRPIG